MAKVKRFDPDTFMSAGDHIPKMSPAVDGDYVAYTDYDAETARADRAEAAYKELAQIVEGLPRREASWNAVIGLAVKNGYTDIADALSKLLAWRSGQHE